MNQWRCYVQLEHCQGHPGFMLQLTSTYITSISRMWLQPSCCYNGPWKASLPVTVLLSAWRVRGGTGPALALITLRATCSEEQAGTKATFSLWSGSCACLRKSHQATLSPQWCASGFTPQSQLVHLNAFQCWQLAYLRYYESTILQSLTLKNMYVNSREREHEHLLKLLIFN